MCPIFPSQLPLPLITLRLTTSSILDTVLVDAQDQTPLFSVETLDNRTVVYMYDHRRQSDHQLRVAEVAAIQWPILPFGAIKTKQSPEVTILGDYQPASSFLKKSTFGGTRKFYIPGQTHPLKWKHVGEHYECTLCSHACTAHRAVATFEPAHTTSAARLAIYASTVTGTYATSEYQTVDMDMMVYLIVTSILLSAPHQSTVSTPVAASPRANCLLPSPVSSMGNYKIDLLAPDEAFVPSHPSPLRSSRGSPASSSSCNSSLPGSPVTPSTELSPISHESSTSSGSYLSRSSSMLVGRRQSTRHSTPPAGPNSITPYHLPPAPVHSSPVQRSPPTLRLQVPSPMASQQPSPRTATPYHSNNALLLDTSSIPMIQSTEQHIHFHHLPSRQFTIPIPPPPTDELPPAYNEIEWTVRVKQPREMAAGLAY